MVSRAFLLPSFWVLTQTLFKSPLALPSLSTPTCTPPLSSLSASLLPLPPSTVPALMAGLLDDEPEPEFGSFLTSAMFT